MKKKDLSKRARVALAWMAIYSTERDIMMFRNVGKVTVKEIKDFVKDTIGRDIPKEDKSFWTKYDSL